MIACNCYLGKNYTKDSQIPHVRVLPLTGAIESNAADLSDIVLELLQSTTSERQGRAIDTDSSGSMEKKNKKAISSGCKEKIKQN